RSRMTTGTCRPIASCAAICEAISPAPATPTLRSSRAPSTGVRPGFPRRSSSAEYREAEVASLLTRSLSAPPSRASASAAVEPSGPGAAGLGAVIGVEGVAQLLRLGGVGSGQRRGAAGPGIVGRGSLVGVLIEPGGDQGRELVERGLEVGCQGIDQAAVEGLLGGQLAV